MSGRAKSLQRGNPHYYPDGRPKASPDDTSMLGLSAVWSEMDEPMPAKGTEVAGRHAGGGNQGRRAARRRARRAERTIPRGVMIGVGGALFLVLLSGVVLISLFIP